MSGFTNALQSLKKLTSERLLAQRRTMSGFTEMKRTLLGHTSKEAKCDRLGRVVCLHRPGGQQAAGPWGLQVCPVCFHPRHGHHLLPHGVWRVR